MRSKTWRLPKFLFLLIKIAGWTIISVLVLLLMVAGIIQIPAVQNRIVTEAVSFVQKKIKTEVRLDYISLSFPDNIILTGLYLEDQSSDTLLYAGKLEVNTNLWKIVKKDIHVQVIEMDNVRGKIHRDKNDSTFNFGYIINAFADSTNLEEKQTSDSTDTWSINVDALKVSHSAIDFHDEYGGDHLDLSIGEFEVDMDEFDLTNSVFQADNILLHNSSARFIQRESDKGSNQKPPQETKLIPDVGFAEIDLKNITVQYEQEANRVLNLSVGEGVLQADEIDFKGQTLLLDKILLSGSFFSYQILKAENDEVRSEKADSLTENTDWHIVVREIEMLRNTAQYYDFTQPEAERGLDANHIWLVGVNIKANDLEFDRDKIRLELENMTVQNKDGFIVHRLTTSVLLMNDNLSVTDLILQTADSKLSLDLAAQYDSTNTFADLYKQAYMKVNLNPSIIALKDVLYFSPSLLDSMSLKIPQNTKIQTQVNCEGYLRDLSINQFSVEVFKKTSVSVRGNIAGLPDLEKLKMDFSVTDFYTVREDVESIVPDSLLTSLRIPEWVALKGTIKGSLARSQTKASVKSSYGSLNATVAVDSSSSRQSYVGDLAIEEFDIGSLLKKEDDLGRLDMKASISGTGFDANTIDAKLNLLVNHVEFKGYDYHDFKVDGTIKKYLFSGTAGMKDKNLDFFLKGDIDYTMDTLIYKLSLDVKNANLHALHLTEGEFRTRGNLVVDMATPDYRILNGDLAIRNFAAYNGSTLYSVDSLMVVSIDQEGRSEVTIRSDIITGDFKGTINVFSLPDVLKQHLNRYFNHKALRSNEQDEQNFKFDLVIHNTDLLTELFFPKLDPFIPGEISGEFNSLENKLELNLDMAKLSYAGIATDSLKFNVTSDDKSLEYKFSLRDIRADTLRMEALRISGRVASDSIHTDFAVLNRDLKDKYHIGGVISRLEEGYQFRFLSGKILLNNTEWETAPDNYLNLLPSGIRPHNFYLAHDQEKIELTRTEDRDSLVSILFTDLNLENITSLVEGTSPAGGLVQGDLNISVSEGGAFNSDLYIRQFKLFNQQWGDLSFALGQTRTGPLNFDLRVEGDDAMIHTDGYYTSEATTPEIQLKAEITKFNLAIAEPLTLGQLKNVSGQLTGELTIQGVATAPDINGKILFKEAAFTPSLSNSSFTLKEEEVIIEKSGLAFDHFTITDRKNNTASIDGTILRASFREYKLNLDLTADNFQVLNSTARNNKMFYGDVRLNAYARITGTTRLPVINMRANLSEDSDFTYVVPQEQKSVLEQKGIVVFVDPDAKNDPFLSSLNLRDTVKSSFTGLELSANIELSDQETFNIVIDPVTGDKLSVRGNSTLTLDMDSKGDMNLSGRYEISEGTYDMSFYKLVRRNFSIEKGSSITWSGDPLNGDVDIRAVYNVETSPIELVSNQLSTGNQQEMNMYRQRLPFEVYLIMKGDLLAPDIRFRLDMPENKQNALGGNVYAKLMDLNTRESELNKQVFSLLVLKRFISENPFESQGSDFESTARTSVSRILTEQLNRLSENVKGIELSFDVKSYEDYSSGQGQGETEVQLGVTKNLFDERLVVKVSGNVAVEGESQQSQNSFTDYIGDLALEYKLTEDGRFRITGFRNSNYDMIDGELIETGAGVIYIKDYNTLRELFKANAKEK
ncbi:MAG TPA: translocation/assembly module TamB domain-containing protein [Ohtaekwangia sp.]